MYNQHKLKLNIKLYIVNFSCKHYFFRPRKNHSLDIGTLLMWLDINARIDGVWHGEHMSLGHCHQHRGLLLPHGGSEGHQPPRPLYAPPDSEAAWGLERLCLWPAHNCYLKVADPAEAVLLGGHHRVGATLEPNHEAEQDPTVVQTQAVMLGLVSRELGRKDQIIFHYVI